MHERHHGTTQRPAAPPTYAIDTCRGARGGECPYTLPIAPGYLDALDNAVRASGWPAFLSERVKPVRHHNQFRIAVSGCANGCSRPHIADLGLIRAIAPTLNAAICTQCGLCESACPEGYITMTDAGPEVDMDRCLHCGRCVGACPEGALGDLDAAETLRWRVLVGGRLGRRPRLADELDGLLTDTQTLDIARSCLRFYMDNWRPHLRFSDVVLVKGLDAILS